jgi:hypothetical protein
LATARVNAVFLEQLIDDYSLYINNPIREAICYKQSLGVLIIDLVLFLSTLEPLQAWEINRDRATMSDYKLIILAWEALEQPPLEDILEEITRWQIEAL